jgi:hypothetical protein
VEVFADGVCTSGVVTTEEEEEEEEEGRASMYS